MTLIESAKEFRVRLGMLFRVLGEEMQPDYWACNHCGNIEYVKKGGVCWKCGVGELIYKGDVS